MDKCKRCNLFTDYPPADSNLHTMGIGQHYDPDDKTTRMFTTKR